LRNDAFQTNRPKLLIWEMPERDMKAPPDMPYREARYVINNTEWLLRVSALAQKDCTAATTQVRVEPASLGQSNTDAGLKVGATHDTDDVELRFSRPFDRLEYLAAQLTTNGSKTMTLEASGPGVATRKFTLPLAGDDVAHTFKAPCPKGRTLHLAALSGDQRFELWPGHCQQPADLLK
jgi:alginate O-acetyltransferase complex protein AlgJ